MVKFILDRASIFKIDEKHIEIDPLIQIAHSMNLYFIEAIRKYGLENFKFEVLEECEKEALNDKEIYYIQEYKSSNPNFGYNLSNGGAGTSTTDFNSSLKTKDILEIYRLLQETELSEQEIAE